MKKIVNMTLAAMLLMALTPPVQAVTESITHTANYDYSNLTIGTDTLGGVTYSTVNYEGLDNGGVPGAPSLPVEYIRFSVPYNATNFTVNAVANQELVSNISYKVYPCQVPRTFNDLGWTITPPNSAYYSSSFYPAEKARVVDEGFLAGENHIVTVAVTPFSYARRFNGIITTNQLKKPLSVSLTLTYELGGTMQSEPIVRRDTVLRNEGFELTRSMVVNPTAVRENAVPDTSAWMYYHGIINPGLVYSADSAATYLIVTTQELEHSTRRLAALKRQKGYKVKVVTMDEVLTSPYSGNGDWVDSLTFNDDAGKLREYLRYCFHNFGTKYVLLAGTDVPYRTKLLNGTEIPTDLYYCDINTNWRSNIFFDKEPDILIGRILAKDSTQIANYTTKLFRYELNPGKGHRTYLNRALYTEGYDMHLENEVNKVKSYADSIFSSSYVMVENTSGTKYPSGVDIVNQINNNQYGYLSFHNHAYPSGILTYGHRNDNTCPDDTIYHFLWAVDSVRIFYTGQSYKKDLPNGNGLNCLENKSYPNICYSVACLTMPFDVIPNYENMLMNFGESFTTGKDFGGVAFLGNTREGFIGYSSKLEESFIRQLRKGRYKVGEAEAFSKADINLPSLYSSYKNYLYCVHNLLGDPEFEIWTDGPQDYSNINVTRANNSITVSGIESDSTTVAYYGNNGICLTQTASSSVTFNQVSPNGSIMLLKHNHLPYIAPLALQNINLNNSQYVIANDVTAGFYIDSNRFPGNVIVKSGIEYEIEASGTVTLEDGFKVENGATFAVYPSCF